MSAKQPKALKLTDLLPAPSDASINSNRSPLAQSAMMKHFGAPAKEKTSNCGDVTNPKVKAQIVTADVGPFKVTGNKAAVNDLARIFVSVQKADPELYAALGTAGMLCCRTVRGGSNWSNHSWGFAIDITLNGRLDARGDDRTQIGLLNLYKYFHQAGWFWGAEFGTEDSMHFEMSLERFTELVRQGVIK